jgi:hypothetical protein
MNSRTPALTFVAMVACALLALALVFVVLPLAFKMATGILAMLLWLLPLIFTIAGLVSCLLSTKKTETKILWVIVIVLAPILGPLLWFLWGKKYS